MASEREFCGQSAVAIGDVATYVWRDSFECSCLRQRSACDWVDLWGRLSNPPDTLETASEQGFLVKPGSGRKPQKAPSSSSKRPGLGGPDNRGQHSNPDSGPSLPDVDGVDSPTAASAARRPSRSVQRRLSPSELMTIAADYQHGRSLDALAREFGVHRRTVADHLERLGIARRVNLPKLSPTDIERAVSRHRAGDSLATVGRTLNVDASTVQRALKRAGVAIRPRPGR
jgi:Helix-turn-helix domain